MTYKNLDRWYTELRDIRPHIPCLCAVNKIDSAMEVTKKSFSFPKKHDMPLYFVSAADGTNVVRLFRDAIRLANAYRSGDTADFIDQILRELEVSHSIHRKDAFRLSSCCFSVTFIHKQSCFSFLDFCPFVMLVCCSFDFYCVHTQATMGYWNDDDDRFKLVPVYMFRIAKQSIHQYIIMKIIILIRLFRQIVVPVLFFRNLTLRLRRVSVLIVVIFPIV